MADRNLPRIALIDTVYPEFLRSFPFDSRSTYDAELRRLLDFSFGTSDFPSRALEAHGWTCLNLVANHQSLQQMWGKENDCNPSDVLNSQIEKFDPQIIFLQDLSLPLLRSKYRPMVGQCSCRLTAESSIKRFSLVFTSIPSHIEKFQRLGVRCEFLPLAFDPVVLDRLGPITGERSGVVFIGGMGANSYWKSGTETLEHVAREIPEFSWYGYGLETLAKDSPLRKAYRGQAWGLDMYRIMAKASIVLNRHGDIAGDYANNLRMFEATGVGAMLLTEEKSNLEDYFSDKTNAGSKSSTPSEVVSYRDASDAVAKIKYYLGHGLQSGETEAIAKRGQTRTLAQHTYASRMKVISDTLRGML